MGQEPRLAPGTRPCTCEPRATPKGMQEPGQLPKPLPGRDPDSCRVVKAAHSGVSDARYHRALWGLTQSQGLSFNRTLEASCHVPLSDAGLPALEVWRCALLIVSSSLR